MMKKQIVFLNVVFSLVASSAFAEPSCSAKIQRTETYKQQRLANDGNAYYESHLSMVAKYTLEGK